MFDSIALFPSVLRGKQSTAPVSRFSFTAMFSAVVESLVKANSRSAATDNSAWYRYPPI